MMPELDDWVTPSNAGTPAASNTAGADDWVTPAAAQAAEPHKFGIMDTWPVRIARELYKAGKEFVTLPGDVYAGRVDPLSQEAIGRAASGAMLMAGPMNPAVRAGDLAIPGVLRRGPIAATASEAPAAAATAAQTALDIGKPLPVGVASPNAGVRALAKAAEQLPGVGPRLKEAVGETVTQTGERVGEIANELTGGIKGRATTGAILRPALENVIQRNTDLISDSYNALRGMIDPTKEFALPETSKVVNSVVRSRQLAKKTNPWAGLEDVRNLTNEGAGFEGLQRARSEFGRKTAFGEPHPGYTEGERQAIYGAMSRDLENVVRQSAHDPGAAEQAVAQWKTANTTAQKYITDNQLLNRYARMQSEESLAGTFIEAAKEKTGNVKLLAQMRRNLSPEDFQQISGQTLHELGASPSTGAFSLAHFITRWNNMGDRAKAVLFEKSHREELERIAKLGEWLKGGEQYANTSKTAHAMGVQGIIGYLGHAIGEALTGNVRPLLGGLVSLGGGSLFARALARPATASAIGRWTRAAQAYERAPSAATRSLVTVTTRNLAHNLADLFQGRTNFLQPPRPVQAEPDRNQPPAPRGITSQGLQPGIGTQPYR